MGSTVTEVVLRLRDDLSKNAERAADSLDDVADAEARVAREAERISDADARMQRFGNTAGNVGSSAKKLAGALDLVVPGAGALARAVDDVADVGEVAGASLGRFGLSAASLGPIMVAAGIGMAAYAVYTRNAAKAAEELAEAQKRANTIIDEVDDLLNATDLAERNAEIAKMADGERQAAEVTARWEASERAATAATRERIGELEALAVARERAQEEGRYADIDLDAIAAERVELANLRSVLDQATEATQRGIAADLGAARASAARSAADRTTAAAVSAKAAATQASTAATRELARQEAALAQASRDVAARDEARAAALEEIEQIAESAADALLSPAERIHASYEEQIARVRELGEAWGLTQEEIEGYVDTLDRAETASLSGGGAGTPPAVAMGPEAAAAVASAASSGDIGQLAGAGMSIGGIAGPIGMAVQAGMSLAIAAAGGTLADSLLESGDKLVAGVGKIPGALTEFMVGALDTLLPKLITVIPEFLEGLLEFYIQLYNPATWVRIVGAIADALWEALKDLGERLLNLLGLGPGGAGQGTGPLRLFGSEGGFEDLAANISNLFGEGSSFSGEHSGEDATPRSRARVSGGQTSRSARSGDVHVHVQGLAIGTTSEFAREISRALGTASRNVKLPAGTVAI